MIKLGGQGLDENIPKCPMCKSKNISIERRLDGDAQCNDCHYKAKYTYFLVDNTTGRCVTCGKQIDKG